MRSFLRQCMLAIIFLWVILLAIAVLFPFFINHTTKNSDYFSAIASTILKKPVHIQSGEIHIFSFYPEIMIHDMTVFSDNKKNSVLHLDTAKITINLLKSWEESNDNLKIILSTVTLKNKTASFSGNTQISVDSHQHFLVLANGSGTINAINITAIQANYNSTSAFFKINGIASGGLLEQVFPGKSYFFASGNANTINVRLRNPNIIGTAIVNPKKNNLITVKLQRLALQFNQKGNFSINLNPQDIPALLISIDNFIINGENLGHLFWRSSAIKNGLSLDKLKLISSSEKIALKGFWIKENAFEKTTVSGIFTSSNFGEWFQKIHHIARLKKGTLKLQFSLETQGSPQNIFSLKTLKGKSHFKIEKIVIANKDKQSAATNFFDSMLNLISLQSISNFLTLDFSAFKKSDGFKISVLEGNLKIENNQLKTKNVVMKSAVAKINFSGDINLINTQNNLTMIVYPNIIQSPPLGSCPVLFIFRFPIWLWKKISSHFLDPFFNIHYKITGTLEKPIVKKI